MEELAREDRLVNEAARGDHAAVKLLLTESHRRLRDHLGRRTPSDLRSVIEPEDILQEAHVEMFQNLPAFEPRGPDSFYRWAATIALNRLRSMVRRHRAVKRGGGRHPLNEDSAVELFNTLAGSVKTPSQSVARGQCHS